MPDDSHGGPRAPRPDLRGQEVGAPVAQPWRRPYVLATITWLYILWSLLPVLIAVQFSFNDGRSRSTWQGFSTQWYCCAEGSVGEDPSLLLALQNSLILGARRSWSRHRWASCSRWGSPGGVRGAARWPTASPWSRWSLRRSWSARRSTS